MTDADKRRSDELLAAYVDGVTELTSDERKRIDALLEADPAARVEAAATRDVLGKLREMPRPGNEPNWAELEAEIHRQVGSMSTPRTPWWRNWRWVVPTAAFASIATIAIVLLAVHDDDIQPIAHVEPTQPSDVIQDLTSPDSIVWIDDQAIDLDSVDADKILDAFDDIDELEAGDSIASDSDSLLPVDDLGWVDNLDDKALDRAAALLEHKKKS